MTCMYIYIIHILCVCAARKDRHLVLLYMEKLQRRRVAPFGGRCGQPQRLPCRKV